jgi:hypothetical protein
MSEVREAGLPTRYQRLRGALHAEPAALRERATTWDVEEMRMEGVGPPWAGGRRVAAGEGEPSGRRGSEPLRVT